ncbi:MAG: Light-independent protochlorophyllide reductase subunit B [Chloroflexi bacterium]|nr:Light-independent protochlorophyllide reductase subunit B [Chloroflexota bacterium]
MSSNAFYLPISEVGGVGSHWQRKVMPSNCLHYCPPSAGGWGIIRVGLLVPESVMLFVSPAGCGRHGAIAGIQLGFKKRLFLLYLGEVDIVTGQHMERIPQAVADILATAQRRPKALLICATCVDALLGSDYDGLTRQLEAEHKIPVRICHMDPIAMDGKTPPPLTVQEAVYSFLQPSRQKEPAVNIIGNFAPIDAESEFYDVMADAGIGAVRHIAACSSLEEFQLMSRSTHNVLIKQGGRLAVRQMQERLGIPFCFAPVAYGLETIAQTYHTLGEFLGVELCTERYREEAEEAINSYQSALGPLSVAVGSTANASPFELARALTEYGFRVRYVFADLILDFDVEHVEWLKHHTPDVEVFTNVHPTMVDFLNCGLTADLAVGFDAGYFCSGAKTVPLTLDSQPYGYRGVISLLREMLNAFEHPSNHREQMYASGMVI